MHQAGGMGIRGASMDKASTGGVVSGLVECRTPCRGPLRPGSTHPGQLGPNAWEQSMCKMLENVRQQHCGSAFGGTLQWDL